LDSHRVLSIFSTSASLDDHIARAIHSDTPHPGTNVTSIAISDPSLGSRALTLLLNNVTCTSDPVAPIAAAIASLDFLPSYRRPLFHGLPTLLQTLSRTSLLSRHVTDDLDLRIPYRSLLLQLIPLKDLHFVYTHLSRSLNWSSYVDSLVSEHRLPGNAPISFDGIYVH
jgi:hypothetical protein